MTEKRPELLGIGIDENIAIVVEGDRFDVIDRGYVAIYDAKHATRPPAKFYFLGAADRFNLITREASRRSEQYRLSEKVAPPTRPLGSDVFATSAR